jgi:adenine-specific DNA-methyltransferase
MPRKPAKKSLGDSKSELFTPGEVESAVPELSALARDQKATAPKSTVPKAGTEPDVQSYRHPEATTPLRPEVGTQDRFRQKKAPHTYAYDPSLSPQLLWAGKVERLSFNVPTLPLFIHERLSTKAILETLKGHRRSSEEQLSLVDNLFGDPRHSEADQILKAYTHADQWVNRLILGDALVVMNSLLRYESLGGQVQMIYIDPPYGVKFGSNFQPFVRERNVDHGDDKDLTREPEMVQAYRDTWELGLHSYLTYLRDRLLLSRELLNPSGSIFVQISDENLHHVRELLDEIFGAENFCSLVTFQKTTGSTTKTIPTTSDYLLWYARDKERLKFRKLFVEQTPGEAGALEYKRLELVGGELKRISDFIENGRVSLPQGARIFATDSIVSKGGDDPDIDLEWAGKSIRLSCKPNRHWKAGVEGTKVLWQKGRLLRQSGLRIYKRYFSDFPFRELTHVWTDTRGEDDPDYVVQTSTKVIERAMLMTTEPGDLVIDPTCGSGTTAYVAEQWGRRWITVDVSRVPLALTRQRLLTASFPWYQLRDEVRGPIGGFFYKRHQNKVGHEDGGIVPHVTLESIAKCEQPDEEVLVDRPEEGRGIVRVCGPFTVEATIPTPVNYEGDREEDSKATTSEEYGDFIGRMIEVLRCSPVLRLDRGRTVTFKNVRPPAKSLSLSAEAIISNGVEKPVAFVFGPEHSAVSSKLVSNAAREAYQKSYSHLYVVGFAIEPEARKFVEQCEEVSGIPSTYVQATPDLMMGDLLKNMRSSHIFSVCGLPEVTVKKEKDGKFSVELLGLDVFDPVTMETTHRRGDDVPAWFLDTDYNGLVFKVRQAFFPRTSAWENLKKELKAEFADTVWDHLAGTTSESFMPGQHRTFAVKVIDDRGNELMVLKELSM